MNAIETDGPVLVLGYGNPLRGDDAVGWYAAQRLAEVVDPQRVTVLAVHSLLPELAEVIGRMDRVIFIDAAVHQRAGEISSRAIAPAPGATSMLHHLTPSRLLDLTQRLSGRSPRAVLITVGGENFSHREVLSEAVDQACDQVVEQVRLMLGEMAHAD